MSGIRIIAGSLRGRIIPFTNKKFGGADITPQRIKEALFSIMGDIEGSVFLDLYSCSGQMGFEALSRGAGTVIMVEKDRRRYGFIRDVAREIDPERRVKILNTSAFSALKLLAKQGIAADYFFIDPPYPDNDAESFYRTILQEIDISGIFKITAMAAVQHSDTISLTGEIGGLVVRDHRKYGSNSLTLVFINENRPPLVP